MRLPSRSSKAFTLIELIVVIVILGILALIAIPTFGKVIGKTQDESAKTTLRSIARDAQALRALDQGTSWGSAPTDAIGETNVAYVSGAFAASTLKAVASTSSDPAKGEVAYQAADSGLLLSMLSDSGRVCMVALSPTALGDARCVLPNVKGGLNTAGNVASSDTTLVPSGAAVFSYSKPASPTNLVTTLGDKAVTLAWGAAPSTQSAPVTGYQVVQDGVVVATVPYGTNTYKVTGLTNSTSYVFQVVSYNAAYKSDVVQAPPAVPAPQPVTFSTVGATKWIVPDGVTSIKVDALGEAGMQATAGSYSVGGNGGRVVTNVAVTPGEVLWINLDVGGGAGFRQPTTNLGGGDGGGAADLRKEGNTLQDRIVVAGGGGGGSSDNGTSVAQRGAPGGGLTGGNGSGSFMAYGGTQTNGGDRGGKYSTYGTGSNTDGVLGIGGKGGNTSYTSGTQAGGAGGGGYYGGGGGTGNSSVGGNGGAGGSSYTDPTRTSGTIHTQGYNSGAASVKITIN